MFLAEEGWGMWLEERRWKGGREMTSCVLVESVMYARRIEDVHFALCTIAIAMPWSIDLGV
jgi:hypothetical protein